ncbi:MAG: homocysteine S-methyltransferase family protein, partial [Ktedonobacterales bacterium]|nr:homocysteine S-methyltransferase family protein [Ktedonobacterales bacterium]
MHDSAFLDAVAQRVIIYDGAMGTTLQRLDLTPDDYGGAALDGCPEALNLSRPDVITDIHAAYFDAGVDVVETNTFTASRLKLDDYHLGTQTHEINQTAARIARAVADRMSTATQPRFVAGAMGPTGMLPSGNDPVLSNITYAELAEIYREQARALIEGGVDVLLLETNQDILEVRAAITGIKRAWADTGIWRPIQAQVSLDTSGRMLLGTDIAAAMSILTHLGVDIVGLNCSTGPQHMRVPVQYLSEFCPLPISTIPNAGLPLNVNGQAVYPLEPAPMAQALASFVGDLGVNIIGGCCGTTPEHMRAIVAAVAALPPDQRQWPQRRVRERQDLTVPFVASGMRATDLHQNPRPLIVGERVNAQGSRKIKQALMRDDYDALVVVARDQVEWGAHTLDVQVALTERGDEANQMRQAVKALSMGVEAPLVFDSTEPDVLKTALETYPGRAIINSINLENGLGKVEAVLPLAQEHGAAVVALTIDEEGMAKTADRKFAVAQRIYAIATQDYGLPPDALIFDALTFPVTTGQEDLRTSAVETLEALRRIKAELPGALTIFGVSNVSFGVQPHARAALNSVFLYHAVAAGLDLAIVNPAHITPYAEIDADARKVCDDLILNTDPDALPRFIAYYEEHGTPQAIEERADPMEGMTVEEKIHYMILHRKKDGIDVLIDQAIARRVEERTGRSTADKQDAQGGSGTDAVARLDAADAATRSECAVEVLNTVLLPAMKDVGDRFGAGELILPFVLQSAEVMKKSVAHLERYLERTEGYTKGKVVLATVFGDVHDIGKNLVNTILSNNGYTVYDLGKQVPLNTIIDKAVEVGADAIGLSALLVSTSKQMPLCVQELDKRGLNFPVIIGGAAINRAYGRRILWIGDEADAARHPYPSGVYYARDAFEGLDLMDQLVDPARKTALYEQVVAEAGTVEKPADAPVARAKAAPKGEKVIAPATDAARFPTKIPTPPFWGPRVLDRIGIEDLLPHLDRNALFRGRWGGKAHGAEYARLVREDFEPRLTEMVRRARLDRTMEPRAIYGYYPCAADGDALAVFDPADTSHEIARFAFPRQPEGERLCLADYFAPLGAPTRDVVAFQVVTMGQRATAQIDALQASGTYTDAFFLHGLGVQLAEALAEYVNAQVKAELGQHEEKDAPRRYSWGYPAIPDLADHTRLFALLPVTESIGVDLTSAYQLVPEQSTAALII